MRHGRAHNATHARTLTHSIMLRRERLEAVLGPVMKDAGRVVLGLPRRTPTAAVRGELGWYAVWATAQYGAAWCT